MTSNSDQQEGYDTIDTEEDSMKNRFLTFQVGKECFGIEIFHVTEIVGMQEVTRVPDMPEFVIGVINLRGQVIPVIDARKRFKLSVKEYDDRTCFVVLRFNAMQVGLVVDRVEEVLDISPENISPPPSVSSANRNLFIKGLGKVNERVKIIIDAEKLIDEEIMESDFSLSMNKN